MVSDFKKKQKRNISKKAWFAIAGVIILFFVAVLVVANIRVAQKKKALNRQIEDLQNRIEEMKQSNNQLKQGIAQSDDEAYIEKVAREELDLQKSGEKVFSFVKDPGQNQEAVEGSKNILQVWFGWLGGWF